MTKGSPPQICNALLNTQMTDSIFSRYFGLVKSSALSQFQQTRTRTGTARTQGTECVLPWKHFGSFIMSKAIEKCDYLPTRRFCFRNAHRCTAKRFSCSAKAVYTGNRFFFQNTQPRHVETTMQTQRFQLQNTANNTLQTMNMYPKNTTERSAQRISHPFCNWQAQPL